MNIERLLRTIAVVCGLVVLVGLTLLAAGLGHFGVDLQLLVAGTYSNIDGFLEANEKKVDRFWKVLGALGTIASLAFAIYKAWANAERNFPQRLREFLERNDPRLFDARHKLVDIISDRRRRNIDEPVCFVGPLNDALSSIGLGRVDHADNALANAARLASIQIEALKKVEERYRRELAAANLLRGAIIAAKATMAREVDSRSIDLEAESCFATALKYDPTDKLTLFCRGLHYCRLGKYRSALDDFEAIHSKSIGVVDDLAARARFEAAKIYLWQAPMALKKANDILIPGVDFTSTAFQDSMNYVDMNILHGFVREMQGFSNAEGSFVKAERAFEKGRKDNNMKFDQYLKEKKKEYQARLPVSDAPNQSS